MSPRRVLVVTPSLHRGGAERHAVTLATRLDPARWEARVLALSGGPLLADLDAAGVPTTVTGTGRGLRALPAAVAALRSQIGRWDPDVLSVHDIACELAGRAAVRTDPRGLLVWKHTYGHVGHRGRRDRAVEALTHRLVTRYGAVCHSQVRHLTGALGLDPRSVRVVPNTVPLAACTPFPDGGPVVAMVAAMRADKGHRAAVTAWRTVVDAHPAAVLRLVGDGPERCSLQRLVRDLGLDDNVAFTGEIADPARVVAESHLVLLASTTVECFPYVVLEAMAVGRAAVSTDVGGLPELVDDGVTGRLVPPGDPDALARVLVAALDDPEATRRMGQAARERLATVFPFDRWPREVGALLDETADAAGSRRPQPSRDR